jgi:hypothetical protein
MPSAGVGCNSPKQNEYIRNASFNALGGRGLQLHPFKSRFLATRFILFSVHSPDNLNTHFPNQQYLTEKCQKHSIPKRLHLLPVTHL